VKLGTSLASASLQGGISPSCPSAAALGHSERQSSLLRPFRHQIITIPTRAQASAMGEAMSESLAMDSGRHSCAWQRHLYQCGLRLTSEGGAGGSDESEVAG
jgi:hypothetical protein